MKVSLFALGAPLVSLLAAKAKIVASLHDDFTTLVPDDELGIGSLSGDFEGITKTLSLPKTDRAESLNEHGIWNVLLKNQIVSKLTEANANPNLMRSLADNGEFDELQELIRNVVVKLPSFEKSTTVALVERGLRVTNILCRDIVLGDMGISYNRLSDQRLSFNVDINDLDLTCEMDFYWYFGMLSGGGRATVYTSDSKASTEVGFYSRNFLFFPPHSSVTEKCLTDIRISSLDFTGSITSAILEWFDGIIAERLETEIADITCEEFASLSKTFVGDVVDMAGNILNEYSKPIQPHLLDPTHPEQLLQFEDEARVINFNNIAGDNGSIGKLLVDFVSEANLFFGSWFKSNTALSGRDLGINMFLRENVLDDERAIRLHVDDLPFDFDPVLFKGHDRLTESRLILDSLKIFGLDTFTKFERTKDIGNHTYQHHLHWEFLKLEAYVTVHIQPSTKDDSILHNPMPVDVFEHIQIDFGLDDVDATAALLLAIDEALAEQLSIGSLLFSKNILPCFFSTLRNVGMSGLDVTVGNVHEPTLSGFVSTGIDRVVTQSVEAAFMMYEHVLIRNTPSIFQTTVRDLATNLLTKYASQSQCPPVKDDRKDNGFIDFRDLLLGADDALALGGAGDERYGDIVGKVFEFLRNQLTEADNDGDGLLLANSIAIRPLTKFQSGVEGIIKYPDPVFSIKSSTDDLSSNPFLKLMTSLEFALSNLRIINLDIAVPPMDIFQPREMPHSLLNRLNLGPVPGRPLNATATMMLNAMGNNSEPAMHNEIDVSLTAPSFHMLADVLAMMKSSNILTFPLGDITNWYCWLAAIPIGDPENSTLHGDGLSLTSFLARIVDLSIDIRCRNCTTAGLSVLPQVMHILEQTRTTSTLGHRIGLLLEEIALSEAIKNLLHQMLLEAPKLCPHNLEYDMNYNDTLALDNFSLKDQDLGLSTESLDTFLFTISTAVQVVFVLLSETYRTVHMDQAPMDPLSAQKRFVAPPGVKIMDFTNLESNESPIVKIAFDEGKHYLSAHNVRRKLQEELVDVNNSITKPVNAKNGVNAIIDQLTETGNGRLTISFGEDDQYSFYKIAGGTVLHVKSLSITGLDSFTDLSLLDAIGPQTLLNKFHLEMLTIEADVSVRSTTAQQNLKFSFSAKDINVIVPLFVAMDLDLFNKLELGSLLWIKNMLPCFLSAAVDVKIPNMNVTVGEISAPKFYGLLPETDEILSNFTSKIYESYSNSMEGGLASVVYNFGRPILNGILESYILKSKCDNILIPTKATFGQEEQETTIVTSLLEDSARFVDFRDLLLSETDSARLGGSGHSPYGDLFRLGYQTLQKLIFDVDSTKGGLSLINERLTGPLGRIQSGEFGTLLFPGDVVDLSTNIDVNEFDALLRLRLSDVGVKNIDRIGAPLSLMNPSDNNEPHQLNNTATLGVAGVPFRLSGRALVEFLQEDGIQLRNDMKITFDLFAATMVLTSLIQIAEEKLATFPIRDLLNFNCWLATIPGQALDNYGVRLKGLDPTAAITYLSTTLSQLNVELECISCTSPRLEEWIQILSTPQASEQITTSANRILAKIVDELIVGSGTGSFVQMHIDRALKEAPYKCPHSPQYRVDPTTRVFTYEAFKSEGVGADSSSNVVLLQIVIATVCLIGFITAAIVLVRCIVRRRHEKWSKSLSTERRSVILQQQEQEERRESELNMLTKSMFQSSAIPVFWRYMIPIIILGNIGFFLSGHLSLGATVNIEGQLAGEDFLVEKFFEFSIAQSTMDIWEAGGRELAILILIFSGIWPYTKQLITLVLWFVSPTAISISRRGSILLWLDSLAKWSMVDIFALIISIAAFRVSIVSPEIEFLPKDLYSINLMVVPLWGLYANMIAQLISQISSHFIIYYHRKIARQATEQYDRIQNGTVTAAQKIIDYNSTERDRAQQRGQQHKEQLCNHAFSRPHRGETDKLVIRRYVNYLLCFAALSLKVLLFWGCYYPSFSMEILGIVGLAVESGQQFQQAVTQHSLFSTIKLIIDEAFFLNRVGDYLGLGILASICFFCVLIIPLIQTSILLYQWFTPMTIKSRSKMSVIVEIFQAWQYSEVYIISVITASWQLGPVSDFMINAYCDGVNDTLAMLDHFGFLAGRDVQCFQLHASIQDSTYFLAASAILLALLNTLVMNATKQYFRDSYQNCPTVTASRTKHLMIGGEHNDNNTNDEVEGCVTTRIRPAPILFTDKFRWLLRREDDFYATSRVMNAAIIGDDDEETIQEALSNDDEDQEQSSTHSTASFVNGNDIIPLSEVENEIHFSSNETLSSEDSNCDQELLVNGVHYKEGDTTDSFEKKQVPKRGFLGLFKKKIKSNNDIEGGETETGYDTRENKNITSGFPGFIQKNKQYEIAKQDFEDEADNANNGEDKNLTDMK